jgi:hypothetical protein
MVRVKDPKRMLVAKGTERSRVAFNLHMVWDALKPFLSIKSPALTSAMPASSYTRHH